MHTTRSAPPQPVIAVLFFLSGFTALVYQIIWVRLLTLTFGASTYAVGAVLVAYMGGMSLGSFGAARIVDCRRDQFKIYALLETAIGVYALLLPLLVQALGSLYIFLYQHLHPGFYEISLVRLVVSVVILALPTVAMGATLPTLCARLAADCQTAARHTAWLYGVNTFGGVAGCLCAGFVLIPRLGLDGATWFAVAFNLLVGAGALWLDRHSKPATAPARGRSEKHPSRPRVPVHSGGAESGSDLELIAAVLVIMLSGLAAMAYENIWTRVLTMIVGTTVYAFTTMLAAVLMGLVLGNCLYLLLKPRRPALLLAGAQVGIGLWVLLAMPHFDRIPFLFLKIFACTQHSWALFQLSRFLLLFLLLIVPTTLMGLSFPLAAQMVVRRVGESGRKIGVLYGFNTVGAIAGSFIGAFILIPFVGLQKGMLIVAIVNVLAGLLQLTLATRPRPAVRGLGGAVVVGLVLCAAMLVSPWKLTYINSGAFAYANAYERVADVRAALDAYQPIFYREGPTATVAVVRSPLDTLMLTIDGKTDASTGQHADMSTQILLSHLPALFAERPHDALLIGLGSGVSLGSLLLHPVSHVDVVEISEAVVQASNCFRAYNHGPLDDPRVNLIVDDGRNHLERTSRRYDLIVSQPSNPWITGVANLFTREYYHLLANRLNERGVACQWVPSYLMSKEMVATIAKTFASEFPCMSIWTSGVVGDLFLIGSKSELKLNYTEFLERLADFGIDADLARIGMNDPGLLAKTFKLGPLGVREFLAEFPADLPLNTDLRPIVEFAAPRFLLAPRVARDFNERSDLTGDLSRLLSLIAFEKEADRRAFVRSAQAVLAARLAANREAP
jgi:spermidine synthase